MTRPQGCHFKFFCFLLAITFYSGITSCSQKPSKETALESSRAVSEHLQQQYAQLRAQQVSNISYKLSIKIDSSPERFVGSNTIDFTLNKKKSESLTIDLYGAEVLELLANGKAIPWQYNDYFITVASADLRSGENSLTIKYNGRYANDGMGFHRYRDAATGNIYVYTNFEPFYANRLFPHFDQPDLKASYELDVLAPDSWHVISATRELGIKQVGGFKHWFFATTPRISSYIFPLHAGPFQVWEEEYSNGEVEIPMRLFARGELAEYVVVEDWFNFTRQSFDFFNDFFGQAYPFGKYDQVIAPDFRWGAMEKLAAVTFNESFVKRSPKTDAERERLASVISHEMAHMWFGNLVTMRWWNDLWLNESFATYMAFLQLASNSEFERSWHTFYSNIKQWAYWEDQLVTTHAIELAVPDTGAAFANFDGITYGKGASVLKQLPHFIGADKFQKGVQNYMQTHAYQNTELKDFTLALAEASGANLEEWTQSWLRTAGLNSIRAEFSCEGEYLNKLNIIQSATSEHPELRAQKINIGLFLLPENQPAQKITALPAHYKGEHTAVNIPEHTPCPDFIYPNLDDWAYVQVKFDKHSLNKLKSSIVSFSDDGLRIMLWQSMWDAVQELDISLREYLHFVVANLPQEDSLPILVATSELLEYSHDYLWASDKSGSSLARDRALLAIFAWEQAETAAAGSDQQQIWFDLWTKVGTTAADMQRAKALLNEKITLPGLNLDQDRRWQLIINLSAAGAEEAQRLVALELGNDDSDRGRLMSFAADASLPDINTKRKWLNKITTDSESFKHAELSSVHQHLFPTNQVSMQRELMEDIHQSLATLIENNELELAKDYARNMRLESCDMPSTHALAQLVEALQQSEPAVLKKVRVQQQEGTRCINIARKNHQ